MIKYSFERPDIVSYKALRKKVGFFALSDKQAQDSLKNAIEVISVRDDDTLIGMGRLIGDGAVICYIQDVMVDPDYQGKNIGREIVSRLIERCRSLVYPGDKMYLGLMSVKGTEEFYEKLGFVRRPNDRFGAGLTIVFGE